MENKGEVIIYQTEDGLSKLEVNLQNETVWLTIDQMAELFQRDKSIISRHINKIFREDNDMDSKKIGINDIEDLNYLAEEVVVGLRYDGFNFDEEGKNIYMERPSDEEALQKITEWYEKKNNPLEFRTNEELQKLTFSDALEISFDEIKEKYLKDYLPMMRGIMRKDSMMIGLAVDDTVTDEYPDNLLALRYKENLKLWTMQWGNKEEYYFLIYGNPEYHDNDEYIGIYASNSSLLQGYKKALKDYKDFLSGGKYDSARPGGNLPPNQLIIYDYKMGENGMVFEIIKPEEIWGDNRVKKLYNENV